MGSYDIGKNPHYRSTMRRVNEILHNPFKAYDDEFGPRKPLLHGIEDTQYVSDVESNEKELLKFFKTNMQKPHAGVFSRHDMARMSEKDSQRD